LLTTGSSDYHGAGKPNRLAENTTSPEVYAAIVARATGSRPVRG
ncbi:phosphatase, partial [Schumannella luteola]